MAPTKRRRVQRSPPEDDVSDAETVPAARSMEPKKIVSASYHLQHIVRAHCVLPDVEDEKTPVWCCEFSPESASSIVATCGGDSVAFIDCARGVVVQKYRYVREEEEFYCLGWTLLRRPDGGKTAILATGGLRGVVRLIDPTQNVCYHHMRVHTRQMHCLAFSPAQPRVMVTGGGDCTVALWDIGLPDSRFATKSSCLAKFKAYDRAVNAVSFSPNGLWVVSGGEDAIISEWNALKTLSAVDNDPRMFLWKPVREHEQEFHSSVIDCVRFVDDHLIASKGATEGDILLWTTDQTPAKEIDHETISLNWHKTVISFLRFCVSRDKSALIAGTPVGGLDIFNLERCRTGIADSDPFSLSGIDPVQQLRHPQSQRPIRHVDVSPCGRYIVAAADNNLVFIWSQASS